MQEYESIYRDFVENNANLHDSRAAIAKLGEGYALVYLKSTGMREVFRNWRCRVGEVDLILADKNELVFVEVKSRIANLVASKCIFENIHDKKKKKLRALVQVYLLIFYKKKPRPPVRIDVVGVLLRQVDLRVEKVMHIKGAV